MGALSVFVELERAGDEAAAIAALARAPNAQSADSVSFVPLTVLDGAVDAGVGPTREGMVSNLDSSKANYPVSRKLKSFTRWGHQGRPIR